MRIELHQLNKTLIADKGENLFQCLKRNTIPIASSCNGDGICGKCVVTIDSSTRLETPMTNLEQKWKDHNPGPQDQRLSCQITIAQNLKVSTTYW